MNKTNFNFGTLLSREEAKTINAGSGGSRCVLYCCYNDGNCTEKGITLPNVHYCMSDAECQGAGISAGYECTTDGTYLAALCKG